MSATDAELNFIRHIVTTRELPFTSGGKRLINPLINRGSKKPNVGILIHYKRHPVMISIECKKRGGVECLCFGIAFSKQNLCLSLSIPLNKSETNYDITHFTICAINFEKFITKQDCAQYSKTITPKVKDFERWFNQNKHVERFVKFIESLPKSQQIDIDETARSVAQLKMKDNLSEKDLETLVELLTETHQIIERIYNDQESTVDLDNLQIIQDRIKTYMEPKEEGEE